MKKTKSYTAMSVLFRVALFQLISLPLLLCFGCGDEPEEEENLPISEITVYNVPANIQVAGGTNTLPTFKIYINASDFQDENKPPAAKGVAEISKGTRLDNGKYSITIKLQNPNSVGNDDPNEDTGTWSGTAAYFSIMICPQSVVEYEVNAVSMKGSMSPLNKGKENCDWDSLIDLRAVNMDSKIQALYEKIILKDTEIERP